MKIQQPHRESEFFLVLLLLLSIFSFAGWYMAESDNELLRKELAQVRPDRAANYAH